MSLNDKHYHQLVSVFGSKLKADEIVYLQSDEKNVVRQLFFSNEISAVENYSSGNNLFLVKSKFKIIFSDLETGETFSNKGERVDLSDKRSGAIICYIAKDEKSSLLAALSEHQRNDQLLGELLGYPKCCIEYFLHRFGPENSNPELESIDHEENSLKNKIDLRLLDISKRDEDICLLSHFPCSWDCGESFNIAERRLLLLASKVKSRANSLEIGLQK